MASMMCSEVGYRACLSMMLIVVANAFSMSIKR
jgi:hypothetical protein